YLPVARRHAPIVVLNNHNVETDLQRQLVDAEASPVEKMVRRQFAARTELLERETVAGVDQVWVCSEVDRSLLRELFEVGSEVVPNVVPVDDYRAIYDGRDDSAPVGPALLYPAQFAYLPSENAAVFLITEVLPLVRERQPGATAVLAGREPGQRMLAAAHGQPAVTVTGAVPSMHPFFEAADLLIIPLREGGGTRLKALEGFACGLPVISTAKGVEGIEAADGVHYLGAESAEEFADAILQASDPAIVAPIRRAAYDLVTEHYSPVAVGRTVQRALAAVGTRP
ncbi:MAG: glycosyltransferase family 4 protein, partial [Acidimicrobiia bacterium]|nr:glycosyltransferase family 4 protein [Acidimicrobiia bacterium]